MPNGTLGEVSQSLRGIRFRSFLSTPISSGKIVCLEVVCQSSHLKASSKESTGVKEQVPRCVLPGKRASGIDKVEEDKENIEVR